MSKYIIELNEDCKIVQQMCVTEHGNAYTDGCYSCDLEELNSDYINEHYGELQDEAYQAGMDKAWEIARRIRLNCEDGGIDGDGLRKMFGTANTYTIIKDNTASEAVAKIKAYDNVTPSDRIEVGDEVEWDGDKYVVTYLNYDIETSKITDYDLLAYDGSVVDHVKKCTFTKTGKHYDIQSILEAMRE